MRNMHASAIPCRLIGFEYSYWPDNSRSQTKLLGEAMVAWLDLCFCVAELNCCPSGVIGKP